MGSLTSCPSGHREKGLYTKSAPAKSNAQEWLLHNPQAPTIATNYKIITALVLQIHTVHGAQNLPILCSSSSCAV